MSEFTPEGGFKTTLRVDMFTEKMPLNQTPNCPTYDQDPNKSYMKHMIIL